MRILISTLMKTVVILALSSSVYAETLLSPPLPYLFATQCVVANVTDEDLPVSVEILDTDGIPMYPLHEIGTDVTFWQSYKTVLPPHGSRGAYLGKFGYPKPYPLASTCRVSVDKKKSVIVSFCFNDADYPAESKAKVCVTGQGQ